MSYKIVATDGFLKDVKFLKKKYHNIVNDIDECVRDLEQNPIIGTALGKGLYKIRLKSRDKQTGKRGGFRVIYYFEFQENVYLIKIYSKNIDDNFVRKDIEKILENNFIWG